jgi:RimJ/RimL family protein N-acetyltransferase
MVDIRHHGVKGMHWGVRRFQNEDGSYTSAGKERYMYMNRARRAAKTKPDMDRLYNTLSREDKRLLGDDTNSKEWLKLEEGEFVVKRFMKKYGDKPIAALDIMTTTKNGHLTVAIMTDPKHRGSGAASQLAKQGKDWFDKNADKYGAISLEWGAYAENKASRHIAEKTGFTYNKKASDDEWSVYDYKRRTK